MTEYDTHIARKEVRDLVLNSRGKVLWLAYFASTEKWKIIAHSSRSK